MGFLTANDRPGVHAPSWYAETAGDLPDHPPVEGEVRADVCVVGGGYAGLSAALHLAEAGRDVVLVEANRIGWGASGRNGGQLAYTPRAGMAAHVAALGRGDARHVWAIAAAGNRLVRDVIARHGIDCDLRDGALEVAWKPAHASALRDWAAEAARDWGHPDIAYVDKADLPALIGTGRYHGGVRDGVAGHLHPLRFALGLGRAAAAAGARLHEQSRVTRIGPGLVETARAQIRAAHVLVACNGYLDGLVPAVARRSMPINNFVVATAPLPAEALARIDPARLAVADTKFVLNYWRTTTDGRLLWGGGESYSRRFPQDIAGLVRRRMAEVYPDLARDLEITHAWGGTLAITGRRMPAFQRLDAQTLSVSGWSGSGVHMATVGGRIAAEAILGTTDRWDVMARLPVPPFPGGDWFRAPLLALAMTWYALSDRL